MLRLQLRLRTTMIAIALVALGTVVVLEERRLATMRAEMQAAEQQLEMEHRATLLQERERKLYEKLRSPVGGVLENLELLSRRTHSSPPIYQSQDSLPPGLVRTHDCEFLDRAWPFPRLLDIESDHDN